LSTVACKEEQNAHATWQVRDREHATSLVEHQFLIGDKSRHDSVENYKKWAARCSDANEKSNTEAAAQKPLLKLKLPI